MPTRAGFRLSMAWFWDIVKVQGMEEMRGWSNEDLPKTFHFSTFSTFKPTMLLQGLHQMHCQASEWHGRCATRGHLGGSKIALIRHEWRACWSILGVNEDTPSIPTMCKGDPSHWSPKVCGRRPSEALQIKLVTCILTVWKDAPPIQP